MKSIHRPTTLLAVIAGSFLNAAVCAQSDPPAKENAPRLKNRQGSLTLELQPLGKPEADWKPRDLTVDLSLSKTVKAPFLGVTSTPIDERPSNETLRAQ